MARIGSQEGLGHWGKGNAKGRAKKEDRRGNARPSRRAGADAMGRILARPHHYW